MNSKHLLRRDPDPVSAIPQMNTVTSYIDGSPIYGSTAKLAAKLRTNSGGKLRSKKTDCSPRGFLPSAENKDDVCVLRNSSEPCYLAGENGGCSCYKLIEKKIKILFRKFHERKITYGG